MKIRLQKGLIIGLICCFLITGLVTIGLAISGEIKLTLPEEQIIAEQSPPPVVPRLVSPGESKWEELNPALLAEESLLAYLPEEYTKNAKAMVQFLDAQPKFASGKIAYAILTEVKYENEESVTLVTLSEASPAACEAKAIYGDSTISLSSGEQAFLKENLKGSYPHSIALVRGNKIITIATTANKEELIKMSEGVILVGDN